MASPTAQARAARNAARTIRMDMKKRNYDKAMSFTNQIWSSYEATSIRSEIQPRLPLHAFLHSTIRARTPQFKDALQVLDNMSRAGLAIHPRTLRALSSATINTMPSKPIPITQFQRLGLGQARTLVLTAQKVQDFRSRFALKALMFARDHRYPYGVENYHSLLRKLLSQHEYTAAALVYTLIVRDHYERAVLPTSIEKTDDWGKRGALQERLDYLERENVIPDESLLNAICSTLLTSFPEIQNHPREARTQDLCQAVAIIVGLLDRRLLPFANAVGIIELMKGIPSPPPPGGSFKVWTKVWTNNRLKTRQEHLGSYLQMTVTRLGMTLPLISTRPPSKDKPDILPPLDQMSLTQLLQASHVYYRNHPMTDHILRHMLFKNMPLTTEMCQILLAKDTEGCWEGFVKASRLLTPELISRIEEEGADPDRPPPSEPAAVQRAEPVPPKPESPPP